MVVVDIWGGENNMDHLARFLRPLEEALKIARNEVAKGYLVNLRSEVAWGREQEFDNRRHLAALVETKSIHVSNAPVVRVWPWWLRT